MLRALARTPTAHRLLPFVMLAYGQQSRYLWRDDEGTCHEVLQGEGGEQGDALMPALFSLGLADALREAQAQLQPNELVIAYLDERSILSRVGYDLIIPRLNSCGDAYKDRGILEKRLGKKYV